MVIDKINTVAYKCPVCGSIEFNNVSVFDFSGKRSYTIMCSCKKGFVKIRPKTQQKCTVTMPCIACNKVHSYTLSFKAFWTKKPITFHCPSTGMDLCFAGRDDDVRQLVDVYELEMDLLMNDIGYDDYFVNNTVMLNTIDKIHDIAEKGNLLCQCGSADIDLEMYSHQVELRCNKCSMTEMIKASTNHDLKVTLNKKSIILCQEYYETVHEGQNSTATLVPIEYNILCKENNHC